MTRLLALLMTMALLCASCTALPAEERAFAVALCIEKKEEVWRVHGRIPTYQSGGGYLTVTGEGDSLNAALADMDAAAPMHLHLSQLRLLVLDAALARTDELAQVLHTLADRADMRLQCSVALTEAPVRDAAEVLRPAAGSRLSKAIDVLLDTRMEQGCILPATLAEVIRMGERQSPVLMALTLKDKSFDLSGGYALTADLRLAARLDEAEISLLSLLQGHAGDQQLTLPGLTARLRDASAKSSLTPDLQSAGVEVKLQLIASSLTGAAVEQALADECAALLSRLSAAGCDVLGLGRRAVTGAEDMASWHALDWPACLKMLRWMVTVEAQSPV